MPPCLGARGHAFGAHAGKATAFSFLCKEFPIFSQALFIVGVIFVDFLHRQAEEISRAERGTTGRPCFMRRTGSLRGSFWFRRLLFSSNCPLDRLFPSSLRSILFFYLAAQATFESARRRMFPFRR